MKRLEERNKAKYYNVMLWGDGINHLDYLTKHYKVSQREIFRAALEMLFASTVKKSQKQK